MAFADSIRTARPTREDMASLIESSGVGIAAYCTSVSGTNTITATCPGVSAYVAGLRIFLKLSSNLTSSGVTINLNGLGAQTVNTNYGHGVSAYMIYSGRFIEMIYDGANFLLLNPQSEPLSFSPTLGASSGTWGGTSLFCYYDLQPNWRVFVTFGMNAGNVSSTPATLNMTLPFTGRSVGGNQFCPIWLEYNGTTNRGDSAAFVTAGTNSLVIYKPDLSAFPTGNARAFGSFSYYIE
jgi:hypothetical protein